MPHTDDKIKEQHGKLATNMDMSETIDAYLNYKASVFNTHQN